MQKDAKQSIYAGDLTESIGLVLGGEQKGIRHLVKKNCDFLVSIPQRGTLNSLNVSAAAAVAMYEAYRQRNLQDRQDVGRFSHLAAWFAAASFNRRTEKVMDLSENPA